MKRMLRNMVVSYPKCGRTWLRVAVGYLLCEKWKIPKEYMLSVKAEKRKRYPYFYHDKSNKGKILIRDKKRFNNTRVIFLVRNPFDVIVSYYHDMKYRKFKGEQYNKSLSKFVRSSNYGIRNLLKFYRLWHYHRSDPEKFMVLRYEDMHKDMGNVLRKVFEFFEFSQPQDEDIDRAVAFASFKNMRKLENKNYFVNSIGMLSKDGRHKTRKGKIGKYRDYLSESDIDYIDNKIYKIGCVFYRPDRDKQYNFDQRVKNIIDAKSIFDKLNLRYWIDGGTVLGFYREGDFLPWDNDVDLLVFSEEIYPYLKRLTKEFLNLGFSVDIKEQDGCKRFKIATTRGEDDLDIISYFLNSKTEERVRYPYRYPGRLFSNGTMDIRGVSCRCPTPVEEYLEITYGAWREPIMPHRPAMYRLSKGHGKGDNALNKMYKSLKDKGIYHYYDSVGYQGYEKQPGD